MNPFSNIAKTLQVASTLLSLAALQGCAVVEERRVYVPYPHHESRIVTYERYEPVYVETCAPPVVVYPPRPFVSVEARVYERGHGGYRRDDHDGRYGPRPSERGGFGRDRDERNGHPSPRPDRDRGNSDSRDGGRGRDEGGARPGRGDGERPSTPAPRREANQPAPRPTPEPRPSPGLRSPQGSPLAAQAAAQTRAARAKPAKPAATSDKAETQDKKTPSRGGRSPLMPR